MPSFQEKVDKSIKIIKKAADIAQRTNKPLIVAFSGGKDSQVLYHLTKAAKVEFKAVYNATTLDPAEVVRFIRTKYPDVEIHCPSISFWDLCKKKKNMPTMKMRFCCAELKENKGKNSVTLTGVRREESTRRADRQEVNGKKKSTDMTIDEFIRQSQMDVQCFGKGNEKITINPILEWTERDVWHYLNTVLQVPHCEVYDKGYKRVGCLFCPMQTEKQLIRNCKEHTHLFKRLMDTIAFLCSEKNVTAKEKYFLNDPVGYFLWWISKENVQVFKARQKAILPFDIDQIKEELDFSPWRKKDDEK